MEVGRLGQCGRIAAQIRADQDIIEEIVCVTIQLQDGVAKRAWVQLSKRTNALFRAQVHIT